MWLAENTVCKNSPSAPHRTTTSSYIFTTKACIDKQKKIVKQQYLLHLSSQYGELWPTTAESSWWVWGTPAKFNRFHVLSSLLHQHCSAEVNQTLHGVWLSPRLVHYIYIFGSSCPQRNFTRCKIHFASKSCILFWQHYCTALKQWASAKRCGVEQRVLPIFIRAVITLGISPHSCYHCSFNFYR